jgi:hypothetical protein
MKRINAWEETTIIEDNFYTITLIEIESATYDAYIDDGKHPMKYMFGLPVNQQSAEEAMEIATANAPDYVWMFDEE